MTPWGGARQGAGRPPRVADRVLLRVLVPARVVEDLRALQASANLPALGDAVAEWANLVTQRDAELAEGIEERRAAKRDRDALLQALREAVRRADRAEAALAARGARRRAREPAKRPEPVRVALCGCGGALDEYALDSGLCGGCRAQRVLELSLHAEA